MKKGYVVYVVVIIFIFIGGYILFDRYIRTSFTTIALEEGSKILSNCLDDSVSEIIDEGVDYNQLINIKEDEFGNIVLLQSNTVMMNNIAGKATKKAEEKINARGKNGIQVPFGYFVGGQFLGERLPKVTVHFRQIGNVTSSYISTFEDAGINQVVHRVNLTLKVDALLLIPNNNVNCNTEITIPICETIIVGNVPDRYWDAGRGD